MRALALLLVAAFPALATPMAADDAPEWLLSAAAEKPAAYSAKVPAAVLLHEASVVVEESGRIVTAERYAVRILNRAGVSEARAVKTWLRDAGKVRDLRAWTISAAGASRKVPKESYFDLAVSEDSLYDDVRTRAVNAQSLCDPGCVFGYESVTEDKSIFTQMQWSMQSELPVRVARFALTTPPGWESKGFVINRPDAKPVQTGAVTTWELQDLPFLEPEDSSPEFDSLAPRVAVSLFPPGGTSPNHGPSFASWEDVSRWLSGLNDPQGVPDAEIAAKARALTKDSPTAEGGIRALAEYVQSVRYVSIQTGLGRGGGYKPHPASLIFAKSYGDCKDKATLLRAMLKARGVDSWPVSIYSGDPLYVREEWPTPQQFNHAILAIRAPDKFTGDAVIDSPLGRLLLFDPTDEDTPFGQVPLHEQNSLALVIAPEHGTLVRMPAVRADSNRIEREITARLGADGSLEGSLSENYAGWPYTLARHNHRRVREEDYLKRVESRITRGVRSARISDLKTADAPADGRFTLGVSFASTYYAQIMQQRLMVFRPSILHPSEPLPSGRSKRQYPAILNAGTWIDKASVRLPAEFQLDEKPEAVKLDSEFGTYEADCRIENGVLTYTRKLTLKSMIVPAADFSKLNDFSERVAGADNSPVVLAKK